MKLLNTIRSGICLQFLAVAVVGSTLAQDDAVLLYEQNFVQGVGFSDSETPSFRHFYDVAASPKSWSNTGGDMLVAPFATPPLKDGFSGSFVFDTNAPERSRFAARITDFHEQADSEGLGLFVGLSKQPGDPASGAFGEPETSLGILDSQLPGSTLEFVRFDINEWRVSAGVVSYDINISYWGRPAPSTEQEDATNMSANQDSGFLGFLTRG